MPYLDIVKAILAWIDQGNRNQFVAMILVVAVIWLPIAALWDQKLDSMREQISVLAVKMDTMAAETKSTHGLLEDRGRRLAAVEARVDQISWMRQGAAKE
jgi:hypothetical protein